MINMEINATFFVGFCLQFYLCLSGVSHMFSVLHKVFNIKKETAVNP